MLSGINHFTQTEGLAGYAASKKVPYPKMMVYASGAILLLGGGGIILSSSEKIISWSVAALILFLAPVSFKMHNYWADKDPNMKMSNMINFMKNMALAGAALMMLSIPIQ